MPAKYCVTSRNNMAKLYDTIKPSYSLEEIANNAYHLASDASNAEPIRVPLTELMEEYIFCDTNGNMCITEDLEGKYLWYHNHEPVDAHHNDVVNPDDNMASYYRVSRDEYYPYEAPIDAHLDSDHLYIVYTEREPVTKRAVENYLTATIGGGRVVDTHNYLFKYIDTHTKGEGLANHVYLIASFNVRPDSTKKCLSFKLDSELITRDGYDIIRDLYMQDMLSPEDFTVTFNIEDTEKFDEKTLAEIAWETFAKRFYFNPAEGDPYKAL
jgi:hypothetical protein